MSSMRELLKGTKPPLPWACALQGDAGADAWPLWFCSECLRLRLLSRPRLSFVPPTLARRRSFRPLGGSWASSSPSSWRRVIWTEGRKSNLLGVSVGSALLHGRPNEAFSPRRCWIALRGPGRCLSGSNVSFPELQSPAPPGRPPYHSRSPDPRAQPESEKWEDFWARLQIIILVVDRKC